MKPQRTVYQADALQWLKDYNPIRQSSIITSLPDISEFPNYSLEEWKAWFVSSAQLVLSKCPDDGLTIFYQSDIKVNGTWIDKGYLIQKAAENLEHSLLSHKIVCRRKPGSVGFGRPSYSHLLCFSKNVRIETSKSLVDVLPDAGTTFWTRGMGLKACELACKMVKNYTKSHTILDPFCGYGSVLAVANTMGFDAIGVDLRPKCVRKAQKLSLP